ncbi:MAG: alpha-amylase family glycosyl hydrolase [Candidatus Lokiarchaeota archaeon]
MSELRKGDSKFPNIYEINTLVWLNELSEKYQKKITLSNVPDEIFENKFKYFDAIWLMGVWERSPSSREISLNHPGLIKEYKKVFKDFSKDDVVGSPYAVFYYHVSPELGGKEELEQFRKRLMDMDIKLILDYVPNHVAIDHLWTLEKSNIFIEGTKEDLENDPEGYFSRFDKIYAHGKDPYFPPWTDTVQINAYSDQARRKTKNTLLSISDLCDGVRCDMAMLVMNKIFKKTWGDKAGKPPKKDFWGEIIPEVRDKQPNFIFIGEVYWGLEWDLQQQGFDYCYDKTLYERIIGKTPTAVRNHLRAEWDYQKKLLRYIENHDEKRVINELGLNASKAAAVIALTIPGATLIYDGQMEGYNLKIPVQLQKRPILKINEDLLQYYYNLLQISRKIKHQNLNYNMCEVSNIDSYEYSSENLISSQWKNKYLKYLIVTNFSPYKSKGNVLIKKNPFGETNWEFNDLLNQKTYTYNGKDLERYGLYVELDAWKSHIFEVKRK